MTRVLIVDDNAENLYLLRMLLQGHGFTVEEARHGAEALTKARQTKPELIISDLLMPVMDGYTLLRHWKTDEQLKVIPFIVYTATYTDPRDERLARDMGANAFLVKPAEPEPVLACVREVLSRANHRAHPPREPLLEPTDLLANYSEVLVRKLEKKALELEQSNQELLKEIAERKRNEGRIRRLVDSNVQAVCFWNARKGIIDANDAFLQLLGYSRAELQDGRISHSAITPPEYTDLDRRCWQEIATHGVSVPYEKELIRKDGSRIPVLVGSAAFEDSPDEGVSFVVDLSERRKTQEALAQAEANRLAVWRASLDAILTMDDQGVIVDFNPAAETIFGYRASEVIGTSLADRIIPPRLREAHRRGMEHFLATGQSTMLGRHMEMTAQRADGTEFPIELSVVQLAGARPLFLGTIRDITTFKQAHEELRQTSDLLRTVVEGTSDAVFVKDRQGKYLLFNPAAAHFVGKEVEEVLGRDDTALFDAESARVVINHDRQVMETNQPDTDEEKLTAAGITRTYLVTKAPYRDAAGNVVGLFGISRDITDRKRAEEALRDNEAKLAEALRIARMGYWNRDLTTGVLDWSGMLFEIFGVDPAIFGRSLDAFLACVHPDDRETVRVRIAHAETTLGSFEHQYRILVEKETRIIHEIGRVIGSADGRALRVIGTARDVTDLARAEEALQLRDRAIQAVSQGILITDPNQPDNPIIFASAGFERMTGYRSGEVLGKNCRFMQGKDTDRNTIAAMRSAIRTGRGCTVEILNYRKDGRPFWNQLSISPLLGPTGRLTHFVGVQTDVTERRRLEEQLRQAQKMEAFGQLAGGVAHDFNNLLTVISGFSELLLAMSAPTDPQWEPIKAIREAGERAAALTRQMLAFSRQTVLAPKVLDLNAVVGETEKMLRRLIGEDVLLTTHLDPTIRSIRADPGQLGQVLMNLAVNARDAMPKGGKLTIETANVTLTETDPAPVAEMYGSEYVQLTVSDTGSGMTPEVKARIFEPFFTTKSVGKGTGLGLAVVHGIVTQSGGMIAVETEPGRGATFRIYFPAVETAALPGSDHELNLGTMGTETILLAEDEESVRKLAVLALTAQGYTVLAASNGKEALRLAEEHSGEVALLITDVVMPVMGGSELADALQLRYPKIKVLFLSGYTDDAVVRHGILQEQVSFLQKPFSPIALSKKVRDVLDA